MRIIMCGIEKAQVEEDMVKAINADHSKQSDRNHLQRWNFEISNKIYILIHIQTGVGCDNKISLFNI